MRKRTIVFTLALAGLMLLAWAPASVGSPQQAGILQATAPPPGPTIQITVVVGPTAAPGAPVTVVTPTTLPFSTFVIIVLLIIIGIGVIVGGMALLGRR